MGKAKNTEAVDFKKFAKMKGEIVTGSNKDIFKFTEAGQSFIGKYLKHETISFGGGDPFEAFDFLTETGEQSFSGGVSFAQAMELVEIGSIIRVTYQGKVKTTTKGRKVNKYIVELLAGKVNEKARAAQKSRIDKIMKEKAAAKANKKK